MSRPKYQGKRVLDSGNVLYEYTKGQIEHRNRRKADRLEEFRNRVQKLRRDVRRDLSANDPAKSQVATAVAIMDQTAARVGNPTSASEGHFGVTQLLGKHLSYGAKAAQLEYIGKSGVRQSKTIRDRAVVDQLKRHRKGTDERILPLATPSRINAYLRPYGVTAKDLRGLRANEAMASELRRKRNAGKNLPWQVKERTPVLREEFKSALARTAKKIGHEPATLRRQYLVPNMEKEFMRDGTVIRQMNPPQSFRVPIGVSKNAKRGLEMRRMQSKGAKSGLTPVEAGKIGIGSGVARARDLSSGSVSRETLERMVAYFSRHDANVDLDSDKRSDPKSDKGYVSGLLWGGRAGERWARQQLRAHANPPRSASATPALFRERIKGSKRNVKGSASRPNKDIKLSQATEKALRTKVREHNAAHRRASQRVSYGMLASVYRRGAGAFSTSHRPKMTRGQWALARVNAFLHIASTGKPRNPKYTQDNDLLPLSANKAQGKNPMPVMMNPAPKVDLRLPTGKRVVLQADDKNPRGLVVVSRGNGRYDMQYWYGDPSKIYAAEVIVDGQVVRKEGKTITIGYHAPDAKY